DAAGSYYDAKSKNLVVNVVDRAAAEQVRQAGFKSSNQFAQPRPIPLSVRSVQKLRTTKRLLPRSKTGHAPPLPQ
ncbi:hypothetical protein ACWD60_36075, partial [Streptomyces sp. NPDC005167]